MTNTQHTPGPWATDGREAGWNIVGLEGERVATVWRDGPHQPANARLIAAAPEMLDALTKAFCLVRELQTGKPIVGKLIDWADDTLELIAKATGK